jgi:hypothetical protein
MRFGGNNKQGDDNSKGNQLLSGPFTQALNTAQLLAEQQLI